MTEHKVPDIAFEAEGIGDAPDLIYRVVMARPWKDRSVRHVNWFATAVDAHEYVERIESEGKGKLISMREYRKVDHD